MRSYGKIYNFGHKAIADLLKGDVLIEEKVDGSQFSFGIYDGELICKSKNKILDLTNPVKMFIPAVETVLRIKEHLHNNWTYRGEFLGRPKHNTLAYDRVPKNFIMIFDIDTGQEDYLTYQSKAAEALRLGFETVPIISRKPIDNIDDFKELLEKDSVLGGQKIEGMVIKNYSRFGADGHALMGKYVSEKFKETHNKNWKLMNPSKADLVTGICEMLRSDARFEKAVQHLRDNGELTESVKDIGSLIKEVQKDVKIECSDMIKDKLFDHFWKNIERSVVRGLPDWYKDKLVEKQFEKEGK